MKTMAKALILQVGEITTKNNFKKSKIRIETVPLKDPETNELIRESETFDLEYSVREDNSLEQFKTWSKNKDLVLCSINLRSFWYMEKNEKKLGHQLILSSCHL